jgi:hypothetical protein
MDARGTCGAQGSTPLWSIGEALKTSGHRKEAIVYCLILDRNQISYSEQTKNE